MFAAPIRGPLTRGRNPALSKNARGARCAPRGTASLLPDAEPFDQLLVALGVLGLQIVEEPPPLADQLEQAAPRVVVLLVGLEMLGQVMDALGEQRDLHLGRAGVALVGAELLDDRGFPVLVMQRALRHPASFDSPRSSAGQAGGRAGAALRAKLPEGRGKVQAWTSQVKPNWPLLPVRVQRHELGIAGVALVD